MKKLFLLFNLFFFVGILNAQISPILGSASSFGVLSGGTVTSTDTIKVTGNVGAMGTVGGKIMATTIYSGGGVIVTNALADLNTAKSSLTAQGGTSISGTLGGQSLNSGVYAISGNAILNDTIILNGDTNAVFIFNITGDLIINSNSMVKTSLFKSVNPKKIFWNVGGAATINSNSTFGGVILATNSISIAGRFSGSVCFLSQQSISFTEPQTITYPGMRLGYAIYSYDKFPAPASSACPGPGIFTCGETVDNGSFEYYDPTYGCPIDVTMSGDPYIACPWDEMPGPGFMNTTPDLFNTCAVGTNVWVPLNGFGTQAPNTGSGYAGLYSGDTGPNVKEGLIQDILPTGGYLTAGKVYFAEMFASLAETSGLATTMGFILTDGTSSFPYQSYWHPTNITNKTAWTRINTCFTATGSEADIWVTANGNTLTPVTVAPASGYAFSGVLPFDYAYYYIDDISIKPLAEAGADQTICTLNTTIGNVGCPPLFGVINNWTVVGPAGVTIATPASPITNVSFTTAGTYTFTLTSTYGSCTATDVVVVTVAPVPTLALASPSTICVGSSSTLTASGATTYSWSGGPATATYTVSPLVTTTYTVTGTTGGCSSTATVTVTVDPNCCTGAFTVSPGNDLTGTSFGTSFTGTTIAVNSNLTIGAFTSFTNCTLRFAPNTRIIIPLGQTLFISKSDLYSCGLQMWDGIEIQPGGNLIIQNKSLIEDAKIGVWSNNAGGTANFTIDKTTFNRNYIGVKVENYSGPLHPGRIRSSTFGSMASITSTTNTAFLDAPYTTQTAEKGVYLFNVSSAQIGDAALPSYLNDFVYLRVGIHAEGSTYSAYNNSFHNNFLTPSCATPFPTPPGFSCPVIGWAIWNNKTRAVIGGALANQPNTFKDITNGILHENGITLDAFYNTFLNMIYSLPYNGGTAILTRNFSQSGVIRIAFNDIKDVKIGLYHINNTITSYGAQSNLFKNFSSKGIYCVQNTFGSINVASNDFNQSASSAFSGNTAVEIGSAVTALTSSPTVKVNNNTAFRMNKGILLTKINKPEVKNNTIVFKSTITPIPNFYYGIRTQTCDGEYIYQNVISKGGANPTSTFENAVYGISVETNQSFASVLENNTAKLGTGLRFRTYTNLGTTVRCNILNRNFSGLGMDAVAIGTQGAPVSGTNPLGIASDNNWTNPSLVAGSVSVRGTTSVTPPDIYTRSSGYPWCPSFASVILSNSINSATSLPPLGGAVVGSAPTSCSNLCGTPPYPLCMHSPILAKIARNEAPFDAETGTKRYIMHEGLLRGVLADSIPLDTTNADDLDIQTFINDALVNTNVGKLVNVEMKYADGDTTGAVALNASIAATSCADDYHKIVNAIFFNTWGIGNFYISPPDSLILYNIAIQDPLDCGTAIYDARVMLGIDINDFTEPGHMMQPFEESSTAVEDKIGVLYPNPAKSSCTYEAALTEAQSGFIMMYDLNGKLLQSYKLNNGDNKLEMDLSDLANGVYMYQIVINGETIEHKKLVINK